MRCNTAIAYCTLQQAFYGFFNNLILKAHLSSFCVIDALPVIGKSYN